MIERSEAAVVLADLATAAGFGSPGPFYEHATGMLGMSPGAFRAGGRGERIRHSVSTCVLGHVLVAATERGICQVAFGDDPVRLDGALRQRFPQAEFIGTDAVFDGWLGQVLAGIELPRAAFGLPLDIRGTALWQALCKLPQGSTASYRQVAECIGRPGAARAVARACASNTLALLVPCHRVVREDGGLGGYRWGIERKQRLLDRERN